ncbi:MAG: hypothetical protein HQK50_06775 [Oligoflexia bacterium]|nr:hypothetical protein [Oligoflexia bacterium]
MARVKKIDIIENKMIHELQLINLAANSVITSPLATAGEYFLLRTCQRLLLLSFSPLEISSQDKEIYSGVDAYRFLLEIICGLRSQLLGECEIVGQFRKAFQQFLQLKHKNPRLIWVLEKLLKDSKEVRHHHLNNVSQLSYASITRLLLKKHVRHQAVFIMGSGSLACDLIKCLKKRYQIHLTARSEVRALELCREYSLIHIPWDRPHSFLQFPVIINTIGAENTLLFDQQFFSKWKSGVFSEKIFIDLGAPSVIVTAYGKEEGIFRLQDIFEEGNQLSEMKQEKLLTAKMAIEQLGQKRALFCFQSRYSS